jgi:photosystem II stability/assembly factor-like uncharacterized protein
MFKCFFPWAVQIVVLGLIGTAYAQTASPLGLPPRGQPTVTWQPLAIGAGGQLTGIDIAPDGTKVVKADIFGAYIWNGNMGLWNQLITAQSWGALELSGASGVWEIRIAPSLTTRLYMIVNGYTYRSDNRGRYWIKTSLGKIANSEFNTGQSGDANGPYKFANQKMAIDPANPDIVYVGTTTGGVWRSFDAGATWARITDIPVSLSGPGSAGIAFDPKSGTTNGRTNTIFVPSYGQGVWQSTDAGATWRQIADGANSKSPLNVWTAQIGVDGVYWCSEHSVPGKNFPTPHVWKYSKGLWTERLDHSVNKPAAMVAYAVAVDPNQAGRVIFISDTAKAGWETLDNGATLVGNSEWFPAYPPSGINQVATDIPWLQNSDTSYMTLGDAKIDPTNRRLYIAEGVGVWWTNWPQTFSPFTYYSQSLGIEELVANDIVVPAGGKPLLGVWDRGVFRSDDPDKYPSRYYVINGAFTAGWGLDYASADQRFVVALNNWAGNYKSGYSNDSGENWHLFGTQPDNQHHGGCIAAATPLNMIVVPANNGVPVYTKNGGNSWAPLAGDGSAEQLPKDGWIFAFYLHSHIVAADRVKIGTFYLYNYIHGLYRTDDGGDKWMLVHRGPVASNSGFNARLRAAPGRAGHLWYTSGPGSGATGQLMRSIDGGVTWNPVPRVINVIDFGFGRPKVLGGYPTIFIVGTVNGEYGIWRSDDEAASWTNIGKYPSDNIDFIKTINGDGNIFGTVYVGFSGSGFAYGKLQHH